MSLRTLKGSQGWPTLGGCATKPPRCIWGPTLIAEGMRGPLHYWQHIEALEGEVALCLLPQQGTERAVWLIGDPISVSNALTEMLKEMPKGTRRKMFLRWREMIENRLFAAGYMPEEGDKNESD